MNVQKLKQKKKSTGFFNLQLVLIFYLIEIRWRVVWEKKWVHVDDIDQPIVFMATI